MKNINLNGSGITFEQDGKLLFNEEEHIYSLEGTGKLTSVSGVVAKFFREFDALGISLKKCFGDEKRAAALRDEWALKGAVASQAGTHLHKQIEDYLTEGKEPSLTCNVNFEGECSNCKQIVDITKEWNFFKNFERSTKFVPFRTEWRIYDADARIAGTLDFICACPNGTYEIYDWKRSNRINPEERNPYAQGKNGLEHLTDTSYSHYCLQQNLYKYILEKNYGIKISRMNLVVLHPELADYKVVPVECMEREVRIMLNKLPYLSD